jgi:hypothetical protein
LCKFGAFCTKITGSHWPEKLNIKELMGIHEKTRVFQVWKLMVKQQGGATTTEIKPTMSEINHVFCIHVHKVLELTCVQADAPPGE